MSDKVLRLEEANTLYKDLRKRISDSNQKISTKLDDAEVADGYLILKAEGQPVVKLTGFGGSGGGGGGGTINNAKLTFTKEFTWNTKTFSDSSDVIIPYSWSSIEGGTETGPGTLVVVVNNTEKARIAGVTQDGGRIKTINIKPYLVNGPNTVRLTMIDIYENQSTISFTVNIVSYKITSNFTNNTVVKGESVLIQYTPVGSGLKTIYFDIDDVTVGTVTTRNSGTIEEYYIPTSSLSIGSHKLEVYFTVQLDAEDPESIVYSNVLTYGLIYSGDSTEVTISSSHDTEFSVNQYETISIPYVVYNPLSEKSTVEYYIDGVLLNTIEVTNLVEETWTYVVRDGNPDGSTKPYIKRFEIKIGTVSKVFTATVIPSEIMIEPVTSSLALYLTAQNRSNNESAEDRIKWEYDPKFDKVISCDMQGFNWTANGWTTDKDGNPILRISNGAKVNIPYEVFGRPRNDDVVGEKVGRTIEIEFATSDVNNYDTTLVECFDKSSNIGLVISAQKATLTVGNTVEMQYKENEHVRLSFVLMPNTADGNLIYTYINGILSGVVTYRFARQTSPTPIIIGSEDATIDIYNIRVYETALTRDQIVNNWIADMSNYDEKLAYYEENNIFEEGGEMSYNKLPSYLPYMILNVYSSTDSKGNPAGDLPPDKGKKRLISGSFTDPVHPEASFTFVNAEADIQGTSSKEYPVKNYKFKFKKKGFVPVNDKTADIRFKKNDKGVYTKFRIRDNAVAESTFTFKADYASSEGANNVELVRFYNDICTYRTPPQQKDEAEVAAGKTPYLRRQGIDGFPMVIFCIYEEGGTPKFLGKYNFNNDKGTEDTYGFENNGMEFDEDDETGVITISHDGVPDESWEMGDNNSNYNRFTDYPSGNDAEVANALLVTSSGSGDSMFEVRYPKEWQDASDNLGSGTQLQIAKTARFKNLLQWVSSTDTYDYDPALHPRGIRYQYVELSEYLPDPIVLKEGDDVSEYFIKEGDSYVSTVTESNANPMYNPAQTYYKKEAVKLPERVSYSDSYIVVSNVVVGETNVAELGYFEKSADGLYVKSQGAPIKNEAGEVTGYTGLAEEGVVYYRFGAAYYYYDNEDYRKAKFSNEFQKYFNLTDTIFYYIFTEMFLMIDSRVKNSFPTYFADVYTTNHSTIEKVVTKDTVAQKDVTYYYKDTVYRQIADSDIVVTGSNVSGLYKVDTESSTEENTVYIACEETETAKSGVVYYDKSSENGEDIYTVTKTPITYPTDVSNLYILVEDSYVKAENPPQEDTVYYEASESGPYIADETIKEGDPLTGHVYFVDEETIDVIYHENVDSNNWPLGRWCWLPYDMDTALGINNRGKLAFSYSKEDIDTIDGTASDPVYNGQDSVLWTNIRKCFYTNIRTAYATLREDTINGIFSYNFIEKRFTDHQRTWPAKVWNEDAYNKYISPYLTTGAEYLAMCLGDKSQQRKWWMYNRFRYLDSKYSCGDSGDSSRISFRAYNRGKGILKIKPYADIYLRFRCGKAIDEQIRSVRNEYTYFYLKNFNPKETETYIFSGDQIIDIRGLNEFNMDNLNLTVATKLQYLYCDGYHHDVSYVDGETVFTPVYENVLFDKVTLTKCTALKEVSLKDNVNLSSDPDLSNCKNLKYVNLLNTKLTRVTFPDGGVLERIYLPSTMQELMIKNQNNIKELRIMKKLALGDDSEYNLADEKDRYLDYPDEEDESIVCKYVESFPYLQKLLLINVSNEIQDKMLDILYKMNPGTLIRLDGFDFTMDTLEEIKTFISKVDDKYWLDVNGTETSTIGLIGSLNSDTLTLTYEDVANWKSKYKDLNFKYNIEKTVKFYDLDVEATDYDSVYYETKYTTFNMEMGSVTVPEVTNSLTRPHRDDVLPSYDSSSKTWTNGTHYTFVGWNTTPGQTTAEFGFHDDMSWNEINIIPAEDYEVGPMNTSLVLYPAFRETPIYSVNFYNFNGTTLLGAETRIDSGDLETDIVQTPPSINGNQVAVLGWGSEPYGSYDPNILLNISDSFDVYSILDWPITSLRIAESKTDQLYYNGEKFDTSSVVVEAEKKLIDETNNTVSKYLVVSDKEYSYVPNGNLTYDDRKITFSLKGNTVDLPIGVAYSLSQSVNESGQPIDPTDAILEMVGGKSEDVNLDGLSLDISFKYGESDEIITQKLIISSETLKDISWSPKYFTTSGSKTVTVSLNKDSNLHTGITVYVVPEQKTLEEATWSDIQAATYAGYAPNWWSIGEEKTVKLDSMGTVFTHKYFTVRIVGFNHNTEVETSGKNTITFEFANTWNDDPDTVHKASDPEYVEINGKETKVKYDFGIVCNQLFPDESRTISSRVDYEKYYIPTWSNIDTSDSFECVGRSYCMNIYNLLPEDIKSVIIPTKKYQLDAVNESKERYNYLEVFNEANGNNITKLGNITSSICGLKDEGGNYITSPVFIPSVYELYGSSSSALDPSDKEAEFCKEYDYFKLYHNETMDYGGITYRTHLIKMPHYFDAESNLVQFFMLFTRSTPYIAYRDGSTTNKWRIYSYHVRTIYNYVSLKCGGTTTPDEMKQSNYVSSLIGSDTNAMISPMFVVG